MTTEEVTQLFHRYGPTVLYRAQTLLRNESEAKDVMQEVFIKALSAAPDDISAMSGWLRRITTNLCLNRLRDRQRQELLHQAQFAGRTGVTTEAQYRQLLAQHLLANADERCAKAALSVYVDGMSHAEAARDLGVSKRTIGNLLQRFCTSARRILADGSLRPGRSRSEGDTV